MEKNLQNLPADKKDRKTFLIKGFPDLHYAQGWNRTADIRIFSPPLYQLSYRGT